MAKGSITFKSNFSFQKLANSLDGIIQKAKISEGNAIAEKSIETINSGKLPALSQATINKRLAGTSDYIHRGHKPFRQTDKTPLRYTSRLIESIEVVDKGVKMYDYGEFHHYGRGEPKRPFIAQAGSSEIKSEEQEIAKEFVNNMNKAMRK